MEKQIEKAAAAIKHASHGTVFTGAGVSVESNIPPFRGENGLWSRYNPEVLDLSFFYNNPYESWQVIKEIFYDFFGKAEPNQAHYAIASLEEKGLIHAVITQNIDNLHQEAGSNTVFEFHGNSRTLQCVSCKQKYEATKVNLDVIPPRCEKCHGLLKPDFIFFGEGIPGEAYSNSLREAEMADVFIVVGTTGEVMPASMIPHNAKQNGSTIIEVNPEISYYTNSITDIYLRGKAGEVIPQIVHAINKI